jgi:hypothetical protein
MRMVPSHATTSLDTGKQSRNKKEGSFLLLYSDINNTYAKAQKGKSVGGATNYTE